MQPGDMNPENTPYALLGGEEPLRRLVNRFYDIMQSDPEAAGIHAMHGNGTTEIREKLFAFLSGWMGGPVHYPQKYGPPRMRKRHLPFAIGETEKRQWLRCMQQALDDCGVEKTLRDHLNQAFERTAEHFRNRP